MFRIIGYTLMGAFVLLAVSVLHYTLPQYDIVRIVNTEVRRVDYGANSVFWGSAGSGDAVNAVNRDVAFIEAIRPNGRPMVYRNEDTGWGWPPYFKFNSANVQAIARDLISNSDAPRWVAVRHYGWRNEWFSIFPNATSLRPVGGPEERIVNWFNILFFVLVGGGALALWRRIRRFRQDSYDNLAYQAEEAEAEARGRLRGAWRRLTGR